MKLPPLPVASADESAPAEAGPFIKCAGGKRRLLPELLKRLPPDIGERRYVEPFLGGGALFFALRPARAMLCDSNPVLIDAYLAVRNHVEVLIDRLTELETQHRKDPARTYDEQRHLYNHGVLSWLDRAARFIYLNKTCFNGLHRVNAKGEFNVPSGRYEKPSIVNAAALRAASIQLQSAYDVWCRSFEELTHFAGAGDFIYFDPPYAPATETANFTSYVAEPFRMQQQVALSDLFGALDRRGCRLMLSNSDVPRIRELYAAYNVETVKAPRSINSDGTKRGAVGELIIRNY